ncbi:hypothetical protein D9M72_374320 [compost metagenome]
MVHFNADLFRGVRGQQVEVDHRAAVGFDPVADRRRQRIDQAAFNAGGADDELALAVVGVAIAIGQRDRHRLDRRAGKAAGKRFAPCRIEAAIGRAQRRDLDATASQPRHPRAIRSQPRPACAAEREHHGTRRHRHVAMRRGEAQLVRRALVPTQPAMPHMELHAGLAQPVQPCAQHRRGLHVGRENAARAADEGVDAKPVDPLAQRLRAEVRKHRRDLRGTGAIAAEEGRFRLRMREVHAALASHQELAPDRRHRVIDRHADTLRRQHFGSHQPRRSSADDGGVWRVGGGSGGRGKGHGALGKGSSVSAADYRACGSARMTVSPVSPSCLPPPLPQMLLSPPPATGLSAR